MNSQQSFQRFAAVTAIVSFPLALASDALVGLPTNFSPDIATNPALMLSVGTDGANLLRWSLILDALGYYLPLLPVALFVQRWLRPGNPDWVRFYTICGLTYILIGAIGAATLAAVQPPLINAYDQEHPFSGFLPRSGRYGLGLTCSASPFRLRQHTI